ncbi:EscU/YscU/HrcU family type III secretion system export apparatus switch protein [Proteus hauseri]|uniref:EscU/YscU/HrcU family type III secretion system export apparatus switch protein n=1 Tax=Proteus hauseri TaxID=183417 RepID=UPI0010093EBB|nr:EscU/YscU/HrcU family type III secretion system export apparatus switch protein [Proteus hauseri]QAV22728.1 EscU/YscU/HrcU family type III secretion system export apparatus switch protein [Proteus hauseri]
MAEKTEKPTQKKLDDSAKKGQSFKSKELTSGLVYIIGIMYLFHQVSLDEFSRFYQSLLLHPRNITLKSYIEIIVKIFFDIVLPILAVTILSGTIPSLFSSRFKLATEAIKFDLNHINPISGFKKIFNIRTIKDFFKTLLFILVFFIACYLFIILHGHEVFLLYRSSLEQVIDKWCSLVVNFIFVFFVLSIPIIILNIIADFFLFMKDMMMEKHEVKQENKNMEGDPEIKSTRKQLHQELLDEPMKQVIRDSSAVIVNPTHVAIGIYFEPDNGIMPLVSLRCINAQALAVKAYAKKIGTPVVRYPELARKIYHKYHLFEVMMDNDLLDVMDILIWLKRIEIEGMLREEMDYIKNN